MPISGLWNCLTFTSEIGISDLRALMYSSGFTKFADMVGLITSLNFALTALIPQLTSLRLNPMSNLARSRSTKDDNFLENEGQIRRKK
jgi:hypothetical protein